jgi:hypothetical protein
MRKRRIMTAATKKTIFLVVVVLVGLASSQAAILTTTTEAFAAASKSNNNNKDCNPLKFDDAVESSFSTYAGKTVTLGTSQHEYSVKLDYLIVENYDGDTYYKNLGADDPRGHILLPAGKTITITFRTQQGIGPGDNVVTLYDHNVSDCHILLDRYADGRVPDKDKMVLKIISIEQNFEIAKVTVQVPAASEVGNQFTKLGVQFAFNPELDNYYIISHGVYVR